jgi:hypothetical protein
MFRIAVIVKNRIRPTRAWLVLPEPRNFKPWAYRSSYFALFNSFNTTIITKQNHV